MQWPTQRQDVSQPTTHPEHRRCIPNGHLQRYNDDTRLTHRGHTRPMAVQGSHVMGSQAHGTPLDNPRNTPSNTSPEPQPTTHTQGNKQQTDSEELSPWPAILAGTTASSTAHTEKTVTTRPHPIYPQATEDVRCHGAAARRFCSRHENREDFWSRTRSTLADTCTFRKDPRRDESPRRTPAVGRRDEMLAPRVLLTRTCRPSPRTLYAL